MFKLLPGQGWYICGILFGENATEKFREYLSFPAIRRCAVFVAIWVLTNQVLNSLSDFGFLDYVLPNFLGLVFASLAIFLSTSNLALLAIFLLGFIISCTWCTVLLILFQGIFASICVSF